ncbi:hypothetical protein B0A55_09979 [Friedmanniomyces simplex]|uniref:Phosphoglycerate mutase n=1 Tax=Friedmanniomyces simplex TaxID=329884 RepID=A0A4U0WVP9_9PEZI|nr:hypothetical protein B0A55_09979 [Friedmanniomyces simplex]
MSDQNALTPRVLIVRHGETEWSKSGRSTSFTEVDLTAAGAAQVSSAAAVLVGSGKLIDPCHVAHVFVSPRKRAETTLDLLLPPSSDISKEKITFTEDITEWNYGDYEGKTNEEIRRLREDKGWDKEQEWTVWSDGLEEVTDRLDKLIVHIKSIQEPLMDGTEPADIVLVSHIFHGLK